MRVYLRWRKLGLRIDDDMRIRGLWKAVMSICFGLLLLWLLLSPANKEQDQPNGSPPSHIFNDKVLGDERRSAPQARTPRATFAFDHVVETSEQRKVPTAEEDSGVSSAIAHRLTILRESGLPGSFVPVWSVPSTEVDLPDEAIEVAKLVLSLKSVGQKTYSDADGRVSLTSDGRPLVVYAESGSTEMLRIVACNEDTLKLRKRRSLVLRVTDSANALQQGVKVKLLVNSFELYEGTSGKVARRSSPSDDEGFAVFENLESSLLDLPSIHCVPEGLFAHAPVLRLNTRDDEWDLTLQIPRSTRVFLKSRIATVGSHVIGGDVELGIPSTSQGISGEREDSDLYISFFPVECGIELRARLMAIDGSEVVQELLRAPLQGDTSSAMEFPTASYVPILRCRMPGVGARSAGDSRLFYSFMRDGVPVARGAVTVPSGDELVVVLPIEAWNCHNRRETHEIRFNVVTIEQTKHHATINLCETSLGTDRVVNPNWVEE